MSLASRYFSKVSLISVLLFVAGFAFAVEKDTGNLGEIRQSVLDPDAFQKIYGQGWILMDGRDIQDSDLFREGLWLGHHIPDARGVYLRGKNHQRDLRCGDPCGDRKVGDYVPDEFKSHTHQDAGHTHEFKMYIKTTHGEGGSSPGRGCGNNWKDEHVKGEIHASHAAIQHTGGRETCPRSVVVNTYIKVNRTPENDTTQLFVNTLQDLPQRVVADDRVKQTIRQIVEEVLQGRGFQNRQNDDEWQRNYYRQGNPDRPNTRY